MVRDKKRYLIALVRILPGTLAEGDRISIVEPASYNDQNAAEGEGNNGDNGDNKGRPVVGKDNFPIQESE